MQGAASTVTNELTDVARAVAGDTVAFSRLVALHHADMARVAYVVTGDRSLAEDAVQSAWIVAWQKLGRVRDATRVRAWLLSVTANEARQIVRKRRRVHVQEVDVDATAAPGAEPEGGIGMLDLRRALAGLSPEDRALLALRYVAGVDAAELGALTGRSASGIRARLSRINLRLRGELRDD
jgi:RNA polymerase sigma-70 factor (ECF subfamily)